ncbi:NAD-dependent epimerase/dehydratase-like protein [Lindgomyces ingoldianus]|uniref:NAD-dependent epimerase/dehydratase-like protein n=1 Tax=Lindgomyces ingoldianus TaxID=673940 RepID=A0ACB6R0R7_9PLEO|nr:NAD-dependent epimerase/dehydratase-like protein [Lindgomyces ingoldianus]KAF2472863.1 NAD-dependent epimerase/dehydratase-like protein [Lindgomyces ingoldianus]
MKTIVITGASGFVGQTLAKKLLETSPDVQLILSDVHEPPIPQPKSSSVKCIAADLTNPSACQSLIDCSPDVVYILHGIMSSGSEANLELGMKVNFESVRSLLDTIRLKNPGTKVIFTSSCAVFGRAAVKNVATETDIVPMPESSYGTQKLMVELLINDYSRRGLIDGRVVRLPTIFVRAGAPTAAASSFVSGIVREPVHGQESELPVDPDIGIWLASPRTLAHNLVHAMEVPAEKFGHFRTVLLPGYTATSGEILQTLEKVAGKGTRSLVKEKRDETIQRIVLSWPAKYDTSRAKSLGFADDVGLEQTIKCFIESVKQAS